ncbi:MAG: hypothetical protein M1133_16525 [Armatimonadetes bacterium]|nr:hypothetical protein [Armatimonadota bacterium]
MRKLIPIILIAVAIAAGVYVGYLKSRQKSSLARGPVITVTFLDVEHGGGIVIRTPEDKLTVIDPGPKDRAERLIEFLREADARSVTIVVTNPTSERAGGVDALADSFTTERIIHGERLPRSGRWAWAAEEASPGRYTREAVYAGRRIDLSPTANMEVLSPPARSPESQARDARCIGNFIPDTFRERDSRNTDTDNCSLVLRLSFKGKRFLFLSDIGLEGEAYLVKSCPDLESDVLVPARHGAYRSNSLELLSRVRPQCCVLMTDRNRPSQSVLRRIGTENSGADLYRTDEDGTIEIMSDGRAIVVSAWNEGRG